LNRNNSRRREKTSARESDRCRERWSIRPVFHLHQLQEAPRRLQRAKQHQPRRYAFAFQASQQDVASNSVARGQHRFHFGPLSFYCEAGEAIIEQR
jgi:hypothetical protein